MRSVALTEITNSADIIDSRDIIERIAALKAETKVIKKEIEQGVGSEHRLEWAETELSSLKKLHEDGKDNFGSEWEYGVTLVNDSYFGDYAEECATDYGYINRNEQYQWPYNCIDWEQATKEFQMDYLDIDFNGVTFWGRA